MDRLQELLERYRAENGDPLSDEELAELHTLLGERAQEIGDDTSDTAIAELREIADTVDAVRAEQSTRETAAAERAEEAEALRNRIAGEAETPEGETPEGETPEGETPEGETPEGETPEGETPEGETPAGETPEGETPAGESQPQAEGETPEGETPEQIAAAAAARPTPGMIGRTRPQPRRQPAAEDRATLSIVAAGDLPGHSAGSEIPDLDALGEAFARKVEAVRRAKGGLKTLVASVLLEYPEERRLTDNEEQNRERIDAVASPNAIVAAGGICAPVEASYDLANISDDRRPIRDSLARFNATRGGIRFVEPPRLADFRPGASMDDAVGVEWTHARDVEAATDADIRKTCARIECGDIVEVLLDAIYKCLTVGNFSRRTFPEQFRTFWALAGAQLSREAEDKLWDAMVAAGTPVSIGQGLGASRDVLAGLDRIVAGYRSRHRTSENMPLHFWAPDWLRNMIRADLVRGIESTDAFAVADATIEGFFTARNINVTWSPDATQEFGPEFGGGLDPWPSTVETILAHEGAFLHLDGGELDFGIEIRDTGKIAANDVDAFFEAFENVAFQGVEAIVPTFDLCPDGSRAGSKAFDPCTTGS